MASNFESMTNLQNDAPNVINTKRLDINSANRQKNAFGDIKNALSPIEKTPMKIVSPKKNIPIDSVKEKESASSKDIDYFKVWSENDALSDDEITKWIGMLNVARTMVDVDETEPPPYIEDEIPSFISEIDFEPPELFIPPICESPDLNTSECHLIGNGQSDGNLQQHLNVFNTTELSDLNQSVFELSESEDDFSNSL